MSKIYSCSSIGVVLLRHKASLYDISALPSAFFQECKLYSCDVKYKSERKRSYFIVCFHLLSGWPWNCYCSKDNRIDVTTKQFDWYTFFLQTVLLLLNGFAYLRKTETCVSFSFSSERIFLNFLFEFTYLINYRKVVIR